MKKKPKVYGPANDSDENVQDEILLAELVARCKERGLKAVNGPAYTDAVGDPIVKADLTPGCRACAMGAAELGDLDLRRVGGWIFLAQGHEIGITRSFEYKFRSRGYEIGAAFNDAMGQEPFVPVGYERFESL